MSQPPGPYERSYSFTDFSTNNPNAQQPGQKIDQELNNVRTALNATQDRLEEVQADDGKLRETCLRMETLGPAVAPFVSASAIDAINTAGGTQLTAVNTAGSTQVGLVNAAGTANLASLNAVINSTSASTAINAAADASTSAGQALSARNAALASASGAASNAGLAYTYSQQAYNAQQISQEYAIDAQASASASASAIGSTQTLLNDAQTAASLSEYWNSLSQSASASALSNRQTASAYADASGVSAALSASHAGDASVSAGVAGVAAGAASTSASNASASASASAASAAAAAVSAGSITPFTGGPVTTPISLVNGVFHTLFDVGEIYGYNTADNSYFDLYPNYVSCGNGTNYVTLSTAGVRFADGTIQATAATGGGSGSYLPLAGGTMTGAIVFDGTSGQYISKGNFDTSRGGNYGISLVCSIGYEFNWQAGWLTTTNQGSTVPRPLYLDSLAGTTLRSWNSSTNTGTEISHTGITFADSSTQNKAAYVVGSGDLDMMGNNITNANFNSSAGQVSAQNITMSSGGVLTFGDSTVQSTAYTGGGSGIPEAPIDDYVYGRINETWYRIPGVPPFSSISANVSSISSWAATGASLFLSSGTVKTNDVASIVSLTINGGDTSSTTINFSSMTSLVTLNLYSLSSMTSTPSFSALSGTLQNVSIVSNSAMTSGPSFSGFSYLSNASVSYNTAMTSAPVFSAALTIVAVNYNSSMTSAPSFNGFGNITSAQVNGNVVMTSAPDFSGCSSMTSVDCSGNTLMSATPNLSYCVSLQSVNCNNNAAMTSPPSVSQAASVLTYINMSNNTSMTSAPSVSGCGYLSTVDLSNCAISNCDSILQDLYAYGSGYYGGFINISGGTNQTYDSSALPSSITNLQSRGWGVVYNYY